EIVGMELRHHVHWRGRHALGNPFQHRIRATFDLVGHHQAAYREIIPHASGSLMLRVTVSQYHGVFASVIAQRPGPNLKSGSHTSVRTRRIFMLSRVMKKLLFQSIGALNAPSERAASGTSSNEKKRSAFVLRARASSACVGV